MHIAITNLGERTPSDRERTSKRSRQIGHRRGGNKTQEVLAHPLAAWVRRVARDYLGNLGRNG